MHVPIGDTDQSTGNAATRPEYDVGIRSACRADGFVLNRNIFPNGLFLQSGNHSRMIASAVCQCWATTQFDVPVLPLIYRRIISGVSHIHYQCHIRFQAVGNLAGTQQPHFFLHIRYGADLCGKQITGFLQQAQGFSDRPRANPIIECPRDHQIATQGLKSNIQGDGVANPHQCQSFLPVRDSNIQE